MKLLVLLLLAWSTPVLAAASGPEATECVGCHTPKRTEPQARFGNGLGRWNDSQCYGCHAELNEVARLNQQGQRDARYFAVPVREEKLVRMATSPLSYMNAPEAVEPGGGAIPRVSGERLAAFLRRPGSLSSKDGGRAPRMMAYPALTPKALRSVAALLAVREPLREEAPAKLTEPEKKAADALWTARCGSCHGGTKPMAGRGPVALGLHTAQWLHAYAKGQASVPGRARLMPVVELSLDDAKLLYRWFGAARTEAEGALDAGVARLKLEAAAVPQAVPPAFIPYLWGSFFRDATCVHCHATSPRAAGAFKADAEGLKAYLGRKSGEEFWRRLETRSLEAEHGLVAAKPGMPMAGTELPAQVRGLIARWVLEGCKDPEGKTWCRR
ncbi:hypothetical protein OV208_25350 [Corallococcus sp. bb12-1]|uniref:hypothetical protein n=1 Tax=Corallococcus sp. bb12-1 TaxID=2996784 RepID=UPI00226E11C5|nr:hypothetical protein [Corallococcus sp. bb12-1]MCY1044669.1 hypothetical protein [Corallococcus sp. bb12-1]